MKNDEVRYKRPKSLEELQLVIREVHGAVCILAGGTYTPRQLDPFTVFVDLQELGADRIERENDTIRIGAAASLQQVMDAEIGLDELRIPFELEAAANVRNSLSLLNFLRSVNPRSPLLTALLALKPELVLAPWQRVVPLERYQLDEPENEREFPLWLRFLVPSGFVWESIARTPKDRPIICLAVVWLKDGALRVVCGGDSRPPRVIEHEFSAETILALVRRAYEDSGDAWASANYRQEMSQVLLSRCLQRLEFNALKQEEK